MDVLIPTSIAVAVAFAEGLLVAVLAWWRLERRDIRVGGEGGRQVALP